MRIPILLALAALLCLFSLLCLGCSEAPRQNLLLIAVDTLRWDHLGSYGHSRETPALDALAAQGVRFERAYATAPWTQPSVASILTGLQPGSHGVDQLLRALPDSAETLPEVLSGRGYQTGCVVSHFLIGPRFGFDQGCESFVHGSALGESRFSTPGVTTWASQLLEHFAQDDAPFLLFVHYFDPHYDYQRHASYGFAAESAGRLDGAESMAELRALDPPPDASERQLVRDLYDEEVRFTDAGIGRLLAKLERLGRADDTWVVLVADHGEEFYERGWLGHTRTLHEEVVRVPLLVRPPGGLATARVVAEPISLVALMPTLLDLLGLGTAGGAYQGASFAALVRGEPGWQMETIYIATEYRRQAASKAGHDAGAPVVGEGELERKHAVIRGSHKLIEDQSAGVRALYDLSADPREERDLLATEPALAADLARELKLRADTARSLRLPGATPPGGPSEREKRMLRELGYLAE